MSPEFTVMVVVIVWGVVITIMLISIEGERWRRTKDAKNIQADHERRLLNLEKLNCNNYGKEGKETKEREKAEDSTSSTVGRGGRQPTQSNT